MVSCSTTKNITTMPEIKTHHALIPVLILVCALVFYFRVRLIEVFEAWRNRQRWHRLPNSPGLGFQDDIEAGFTSAQFDLHENILNEDPRTLDETAKTEIHKLMASEGISFDDARLKYFQSKLSENGIGADGVPRDSRTVTFS